MYKISKFLDFEFKYHDKTFFFFFLFKSMFLIKSFFQLISFNIFIINILTVRKSKMEYHAFFLNIRLHM